MADIAAMCTQCGALLQVDDSLEADICTSCCKAFVVEKAIDKYRLTLLKESEEGQGLQFPKLVEMGWEEFEQDHYFTARSYWLRAKQQSRLAPLCSELYEACFWLDRIGDSDTPGRWDWLEDFRLALEALRTIAPGEGEPCTAEHGTERIAKYVYSRLVELVNLRVNAIKLGEREGIKNGLEAMDSLVEFIEWGLAEDYFKPKKAGFIFREWLSLPLTLLEHLSLCYKGDYTLSSQGAQHCYDMAAKLKSYAAQRQENISLCSRLVPLANSGDGVHCRIIEGRSSSEAEYIAKQVSLYMKSHPLPAKMGNLGYIWAAVIVSLGLLAAVVGGHTAHNAWAATAVFVLSVLLGLVAVYLGSQKAQRANTASMAVHKRQLSAYVSELYEDYTLCPVHGCAKPVESMFYRIVNRHSRP